jgi:hypothetical protein
MVIPKVAIIRRILNLRQLIPVVWDCFKGCPEIKAPVELMDCPKMVIKVKISTGNAYSYSVVGSINIPTDTKKMAPNVFTGLIKTTTWLVCFWQ